ncbi:hypothetical protein RhiirA1_404613 [Rhizophagus irregularis]|uniref:Uncharacterized protein n=1 Tax=Rhizophagus irregularis TaxID=588596 RepID=A0A2N0QPJ9_9GLOM|nr:hypothetical protein RhiirA1_404613 [Rhizophagus irregularis]
MSSIIELSDIEEYNEENLIEMSENNSSSENENETFAFFTTQLQVPKVIYTAVPVEYPETSPEGVATVYNVTGWKNAMDAFSDVTTYYLLVFNLITSHKSLILYHNERFNIQQMVQVVLQISENVLFLEEFLLRKIKENAKE